MTNTNIKERVEELVGYLEEDLLLTKRREIVWDADFRETTEDYWKRHCKEQRNIARAEAKVLTDVIESLNNFVLREEK